MDSATTITPATAPHRQRFDRRAWETALLSGDRTRDERQTGLVLAHLADPYGELAAGGPQEAGRLAGLGRVAAKHVRLALNKLEKDGLISRPSIHDWTRQSVVRPITLTVPAPRRTEPPHTGGTER